MINVIIMGKKVFLKIIQESYWPYWSHDDDDEYSPINIVRKVIIQCCTDCVFYVNAVLDK
jgi:hypothetical protein